MLALFGRTLETTSEGFLVHAEQWDRSVAEALAEAHGLDLTPAHWQVLELLRSYCEAGNEPPSMRQLVGLLKPHLGEHRVGSIYLMKLFGPSPAKMAARLAGLPKPKNCF